MSNDEADEQELEEVFERLSARLLGDPSVTQGTGFGKSKGLRIDKKIFAIFGPDGLTVKLPKGRVDDLVASGSGHHFDPGRGRLMKEWVTVPARHCDSWEQLASDALDYVRPR